MSNRLKRVHDLLKKRLSDNHIESAGLEATLLIEHLTGLDRAAQILSFETDLSHDQILTLQALADRRLKGEPLDNIFGYREFFGRRFDVNKDVLSPRPETEMIIDFVLGHSSAADALTLLDLGTGSGAIAITILAERPNFRAVATDISHNALAMAKKNAEKHQTMDRVDFIESHWFRGVKPQVFDFVLSNPPYITDDYMTRLAPEVSGFDPDIALCGGADGLDAYKIITQHADKYLGANGFLCLEIGFDQGASVAKLLKEKGFKDVTVKQDLAGHDRMVIARSATKPPIHIKQSK